MTNQRLYLQLLDEDEEKRAEAHILLAEGAIRRRRVDLAIRHYREVLILDPKHQRALQALTRLGANERPKDRDLRSKLRRLVRRP